MTCCNLLSSTTISQTAQNNYNTMLPCHRHIVILTTLCQLNHDVYLKVFRYTCSFMHRHILNFFGIPVDVIYVKLKYLNRQIWCRYELTEMLM